MKKSILKKSDLQFKQAFPGLNGVDIMARSYPIEPMLVFTEYHMDKPVFGPHPHAGVSVMTYMLPDSKQGFINRDSLGDFSYIEPGGLHISQAGSGMFHDEFPKETGIDTHGFQIWINHKETDRWVKPKAIHANANEIQEVQTTDFKVRIVHGEFNGEKSPYKLVTDIDILHIILNPNKSIILNANEMAFVYGLNGISKIGDTEIKAQTLVNFNKEGNQVEVNAGSDGFEFMFCTANPLNEPIVYGGPFVMTTNEQMRKTQHRLLNGEMGELKPYKP
ncbi:MAG: pirin-like C-terminal cupin domain-containing protein [Leadbetterella sp.]|nr:pirin-like C-terminal cupin domain-containing protein [Leadbetterella sp.]